jgi:hypothetical protein
LAGGEAVVAGHVERRAGEGDPPDAVAAREAGGEDQSGVSSLRADDDHVVVADDADVLPAAEDAGGRIGGGRKPPSALPSLVASGHWSSHSG